MSLHPELLRILACPRCKGKLIYREVEAVLDCETCRLRYDVRDDIPILLVDDAKPI